MRDHASLREVQVHLLTTHLLRILPVSALALIVFGCGSDGNVTPASSVLGQVMRGSAQEPTSMDPAAIAAELPCPAVRILPDTEFIRREVTGDAPPEDRLRWQASITKTARECRADGEGLIVRVGMSGRVIEGRVGAPEVVELPIRVAVREGGEVTYSRLHNVQVSVTDASQTWAFVDENAIVQDPASADIVVGFDG